MKHTLKALAKRLTAAICAAFYAATVLTAAGCDSYSVTLPEHKNTAEAVVITDDLEYFERLSEAFAEYADCTLGINAGLESESYDLSFYETAMSALDKLEAITPPEMFAEAHKNLCESIPNERGWLAALYECIQIAKDGREDSDKFADASKRLSECTENSRFSKCLIDIYSIYKEAYS